MIHVFVGTKAQLIKMAPLMQELDRRQVPYNFIDAGQHGGLTDDLVDQFGLREPDVRLRARRDNIKTLPQAVSWTTTHLARILLRPRAVKHQVFQGKSGVCLIHGDTLTTLLSLLYARRCGLQVAHVEAGLRSFNLMDPFPEEIIRLLAMRFSHQLFAPTDWALANLERMGYAAKSYHAGGNTILDTIRFALAQAPGGSRPERPYAVVTAHRVETIYSRRRLALILDAVALIAADRLVLFVMHEPTSRQLARFGLLDNLRRQRNVETRPLQPYLTFVNLLAGAEMVITDGGSIQEESYYLNVPCLIMRAKTERQEGLGENARLARFELDQVAGFAAEVEAGSLRSSPDWEQRPAAAIVDRLLLACTNGTQS